MSLAQVIQNAWNRQAKWLVVLRPLSWLYKLGFEANKSLYRKGVKKSYTAPVPVMVIGNITVGGSGKTPLLIQLVHYLKDRNIRLGVISRGYGGQGPFPAYITADTLPTIVGDEPALIVQSTGIPMAVGPNRQQSIELLLAKHELGLIICDDGLQHWALNRQIEWIVLDNNRGLGNEKLLPEGYLRESVERLNAATVIEHATHPRLDLNMHLEPAQPYSIRAADEQLFNPNLNYYAVVGIGFPKRFYQTLQDLGLSQFQSHEFPDHHDYSIEDLQFEDDHPIITTEKDAVKMMALLQQYPEYQREIWVVPVEAVLSAACYSTLHQQLQDHGIHIS